jgi:hypothetical protein
MKPRALHVNTHRNGLYRCELSARAENVRVISNRQAAVPSGWSQKTANGHSGEIDRLRNLGEAQQYNINVDHGAFQTIYELAKVMWQLARLEAHLPGVDSQLLPIKGGPATHLSTSTMSHAQSILEHHACPAGTHNPCFNSG